jgi:hypothetical protein
MSGIVDLLRSVAGSGETVTIVYNGGSRPGESRVVIPISVSNDKLLASQPGSCVNKTFRLDRIASVELASGQLGRNERAAPPQGPTLPEVPSLKTLAEYVDLYRPELVKAGWHLYESADSLRVAGFFKNGKPKKGASVGISYSDPSTERAFDLDTGTLVNAPRELTGREKPWSVGSWRFTASHSYSILEHALAVFLAEVRASDPKDPKRS